MPAKVNNGVEDEDAEAPHGVEDEDAEEQDEDFTGDSRTPQEEETES